MITRADDDVALDETRGVRRTPGLHGDDEHAGLLRQLVIADHLADNRHGLPAEADVDQVALLHTGRLPGAVASANGEFVLTIGHVPDADLDLRADGIALAGQDRLPPVVHQYQYKPATAAHVARLWPAPA